MGYSVCKDGKGFYVLWEEQREGVKQKRRVKAAEWPNLGFSKEKSLDENRTVAETLNRYQHIRRQESKRNALEAKRQTDLLLDTVALPKAVLIEFERDVVAKSPSKSRHWEVAKTMIREVGLPPKDWKLKKELFWEWWARKKCSPAYIRDIRAWLNRWAEFYGERTGQFAAQVPSPSGGHASRIRREYENYNLKSSRKRRRPSGRLSFTLLNEHRKRFTEEEYNWFYIEIAFGLRLDEMEQSLKNPTRFRVSKRGLHIYQVKLERFASATWEKRWKLIPVKTVEQQKAIALIKAGQFKKPVRSKLKGIVDSRGRQIHFNAGRKEFSPYMQSLGFGKADVSGWLGHKSIDTTTEHYDDPTSYAPSDDDEEAA